MDTPCQLCYNTAMDRHEKRNLHDALVSWMIYDPEWVREELVRRLDDNDRLNDFDPTWLIALNEILRRWTGPRL